MEGSHSNPKRTSILATLRKGPLKCCVVGCGNWGTVVSKLAADNALNSYLFNETVHMYVRPGQKASCGLSLVDVVNRDHENPKFLPGICLPNNLVATENIDHIKQADLLIFVIPHQFIRGTCNEIMQSGGCKATAQALTLVKGIEVHEGKPVLFSDIISGSLGIPCCAMSGANVAQDIALGQFSESTIGYEQELADVAEAWQTLLDRPHFKIDCVPDVAGVQVNGAIKNLVALAAGFSDGLGYGTNTKAAIIRLGLKETRNFAKIFFPTTTEEVYFESAGFADLITTCFGGRNVRCAREFVKRGGPEGKTSWVDIEKELLGGQKMQGQLTCEEVHSVLVAQGCLDEFPLFKACYSISFENKPADNLLEGFAVVEARN